MKKKLVYTVLNLLFVSLSICSVRANDTTTINVSEYGIYPNIRNDIVPKLNELLSDAAKETGAVVIRFRKGKFYYK